nr:zinc knuckle CX2CX4HX4C [Tanacetum cinerariifolium]
MTSEFVQGANVAIPLAVVEEVSQRFKNTLYGYFIGKRLKFPLVETYVKNAWAKFGLEAFSEIGLSLITSQLGRPVMLDAYTSTMCQKSWGRNSYARALVEVSSLAALKESFVVAIPFPNGTGHSLETVKVGYEWQPPWCESCKIFDHRDAECPKMLRLWILLRFKTRMVLLRLSERMVKVSRMGRLNKWLVSLEDVLDDDDKEVEEVYIEDNGRHAKQYKEASTLSDQVQDV